MQFSQIAVEHRYQLILVCRKNDEWYCRIHFLSKTKCVWRWDMLYMRRGANGSKTHQNMDHRHQNIRHKDMILTGKHILI